MELIDTRFSMDLSNVWKVTALLVVALTVSASVVPSGGVGEEEAMRAFRHCAAKFHYVDNMTTYSHCIHRLAHQMDTMCRQLASDNAEGPFCFDEGIKKQFPVTCVQTESGQKATRQLYTQFLIMQLDHCANTYGVGHKRLTKLLLQLQGYSWPPSTQTTTRGLPHQDPKQQLRRRS